MAAIPSIKGSAFTKVVEDVGKLLDQQVLPRSEAERWLQPEDFALLGKEVVVSRWYDIRCYARMCELLLAVEGQGNPEYLRGRGRATARRLLEAGLYSQLEYLHRTEASRTHDAKERFAALGRDLRLITTLSSSILNFSKWTSLKDPGHERRYLIEVSDAADVPEVLCWTSDGLVNQMATHHSGGGDLWSWERVRRDLLIFRMTRDR
jgi:hypothetical protein